MKKASELTETQRIISAAGNRTCRSSDARITIYLSLLLVLAITVTSCQKNKSMDSTPVFLFGITADKSCQGVCNHYFALLDGQLYPAVGQYNPGPLVITEQPLPETARLLAENLLQQLPAHLLHYTGEELVVTGNTDEAQIHIEYLSEGTIMKWTINPDTTVLPAEVRGYVQKTLNALCELKI